MKCLSFLITILIAFVVLFSSCEKKDGKSNAKSSTDKVLIMENSSDPLFLSYKDLNGKNYEFFGTRDDLGNPIGVDQVFVSQGDSVVQQFYFDNLGRPTKMFSADGEIQIDWLTDTSFLLKLISKDAEDQFVTEINLNQPISSYAALNRTESNRNGRKVKLDVSSTMEPKVQHDNYNSASGDKCKIFVTRCGEPDNYSTVYVKVTTTYPEFKLLGTFPAKRTGNGTYAASIPKGTAPSINLGKQCENLVNVFSNMCSVHDPAAMEHICLAVSAALAQGIITVPAAAKFMTLCTLANSVSTVACASPGPGAPSVFDAVMEKLNVCDVEFLDRTFHSDIVLYPKVTALPHDITGAPVTISGNDAYPSLDVEISNETHVRPIIISPNRPFAGQNYVASVEIYCAKIATNVFMSIEGTDEYYDDVSYVVSETQAESRYTLSVPGAEQGVKDVIKLIVTLPDGKEIKRTSSFVFQ